MQGTPVPEEAEHAKRPLEADTGTNESPDRAKKQKGNPLAMDPSTQSRYSALLMKLMVSQ